MFTGIIESKGTIVGVQPASAGVRLRVEVGSIAEECVLGASVCISGVCLTVAGISGQQLEFDVIRETLDRSTLGAKGVADLVNLERSLRVGDRVDGHFVQGHVDGKARVDRIERSSRAHIIWLRRDPSFGRYVVPKGSIAVDGVSLTIAAVRADVFSVALIPTTLEWTTLSSLTGGDWVNVESDIITRTIVHRLAEMGSGSGFSLETLQKAGFA